MQARGERGETTGRAASGTVHRLFAVAPPGLEAVTAREVETLGTPGRVRPGGVEFRGDLRGLYRANLHLRTAHRVLVRVAAFAAPGLAAVARETARYPWEIYVPAGCPVRVRVTAHRSRLYHTGAVAERVLRGIADRLGRSVEPASGPSGAGEVLLVVRVAGSHLQVSVDSSGAHLHRRGWRRAHAAASLRETLAAGMLLAAGWDGTAPLLDPFCGAGTIAVEAAFIAAGRAPGIARSFAFEAWRNFDPALFDELRELARRQERPVTAAIRGADLDPRAVRAARANAARAGVAEAVTFLRAPVEALEPVGDAPGWIVSDPPYGRRSRVPGGAERAWAALGRRLRRRFSGWRVVVLGPDRLAPALGLPLEPLALLDNGGLKVRLLRGRVPGR
ncbi:class I SAM-dependent RNA methyltransferase [Dissulfurirhabdus thermomarina]|uniref:Class I SAM-dependent RNA methyltransferase n=1 Tax=Dissulfurirhabdus thermomarina TaxID=1765737 RepID=A0A6N9TJU8_DISTH|nr:class I SAM-dependent RNA methyltransferase [Dissulfurirhabdus thermomarina]NDY41359.1 class I SAM-dependent RNA methyltransferase [Dissulfurirhabdus thermomarina]NMX23258.1 class I SAM-dependent RNA methyltransferase [Dissulfurirhabdus thermomarina]